MVREKYNSFPRNSIPDNPAQIIQTAISPIPAADKNKNENTIEKQEKDSPPPSPVEADKEKNLSATYTEPPCKGLTAEAIRFLQDIIAQPLSTTVSRYHRLHFSRRRGDAIRCYLSDNNYIEPVRIATRTGQVVLYQFTAAGRDLCNLLRIAPAPLSRESLEHRYWVRKTADYYKKQGYEIAFEYAVKDNGKIDILAEKPGQRIAIEVETGKSAPLTNLINAAKASVDRFVFVATSPVAVSVCKEVIEKAKDNISCPAELLTWLDIS
jgi:hypothetical protein